MNIENKQWDLAEAELTAWQNEDKAESSLPLSDILKSAYLAFRQKQIERLSQFCRQAFEYYQEREKEKEKERERILRLQEIQGSNYRDNTILFKKGGDRTESERKKTTLEENKKIINGILLGNYQVFNDLYEYEFPKTIKLVLNNSGNIDAAKDLFQDAIVILIEKVNANKLDLTCSVSTYLYSICRYLWMDQLRQNKRELPLNDFYDYIKADISVVGFENTPDIYENVNTAIETLGDPCKQLLECFYYKNMGWDEIASSLGYANATSARNQKYKCLERVRKMVSVEVE